MRLRHVLQFIKFTSCASSFREISKKTVTGCRIIFVEGSSAARTAQGPQNISGLLTAWSRGDEEALKDLVAVLYPELRRIARRRLARRPEDCSLESAAVANEAYL